MLHLEDLCEVIHLDVLCCPSVEFNTWIVVLVTRHNVLRRPSNWVGGDHLSKSAEQVELRIRRFQRPSIEGLV